MQDNQWIMKVSAVFIGCFGFCLFLEKNLHWFIGGTSLILALFSIVSLINKYTYDALQENRKTRSY